MPNRLTFLDKREKADKVPVVPVAKPKSDTGSLSAADWCAVAWGYITIGLYTAGWIAPSAYGLSFDTAANSFAVAFALFMLIRRRARLPFSILLTGVMVLQIWSIICAVVADRYLGRPLALNRSSLLWVEAMIPFFTGWFVVMLRPEAAFGIRRIILSAFLLSSGVAWLQFLRFGPALKLSQIYTYKAIDNWDGHPGIRSVGLTVHPTHMAFQAAIALALLAAPVLWRRLSAIELTGICFASAAVIFTQARITYLGVVVIWAVLLILTLRRDRRQALWLAGIAFACLSVGVMAAAKRFDYVASSVSGQNQSLEFREGVTWAQIHPIYPKFWLTGIGPSDGLLLGTGYEDKYVPIGRVFENEYLVTLAMYGIPGLALLVLTWVASLTGYIVALARSASPARKQMLAVATVATSFLILLGFSANTIDYRMVLPSALLFAGASCNPAAIGYRPRVRTLGRRPRRAQRPYGRVGTLAQSDDAAALGHNSTT